MTTSLGRARFHMTITNLTDGETIEAQYNPDQLQEAIEVGWGRMEVPGMSHRPLQFGSTGNLALTFDLFFKANTTAELFWLEEARNFLHSVCYPIRAENVASGSPPFLLFVWPGIYSLTCVLTGLTIKPSRFDQDGKITMFTASVAIEEYREGRIYSEQVRQVGTIRSSGVISSGETDLLE